MNNSLMMRAKAIRGFLECDLGYSLVALFTRLTIFGIFYRSGKTKLPLGSDLTVTLFQEEYLKNIGDWFFGGTAPDWMAVVSAYLATITELGASSLLLVGLFTRLATLPLFGVVLFIQFFVYWNDWPHHTAWLAMLLVLVTRGPGIFSLDHILFGKSMSSSRM